MGRSHHPPVDATLRSHTPSAAWILRQIAAEPSAPLLAAVVGPGGTGKSVLLDGVAREYTNAAVAVLRGGPDSEALAEWLATEPWRDATERARPVLVDNAHRLDPALLDALRRCAESDHARMVVAYRPWPRPPALSALGASLTRRRSPVVVGHLDHAAVAARIAGRVGCEPPESLVDLVHEQTGGLPSLVDLVTQALQDTGRFDPRHPEQFRRPNAVNVSTGLAERLRYQLEALDPDVYRLLQAMAVGAPLDAEILGSLLGADPGELTETVEAARATGLLTESGELIAFIRNLVLRLLPVLPRRELQRRLAVLQLDRGGSVLAAGRQLLGTGASGSRVAAVLEKAGDEALAQSPALAAEFFAATIDAGASPQALAARQAQAVALAGDLDQALRLADQVVSDPAAPDRDRGVSVAAAVLAHRGLLARSAELYRSLPPDAPGGRLLAVPELVGIGALEEAQSVLDAAEAGAYRGASSLAGAEVLIARGMLATMTGTHTAALSQLAQAAVLLEPAGQSVLLPDTPAALVALVAMQIGELAVADSALRRAVGAKLGGRPAHDRHMLLHGWTAMVHGKLDVARTVLQRVTRQERPLEPRDDLFAAALAVGVARREKGAAALSAAWRQARTALVRYPVDLYALQPLGELAVAAAALGEREWVIPHLRDAEGLLEKLGEPVLWSVPLYWYQMHADLLAEELPETQRLAQAQRHADKLAEAATGSPYAAVLASAAHCWLDVMSGQVGTDAVQSSARRLQGVGLAWEGARLVGQAASRITDRRAITALLNCARALHGSSSADTPPASPASDTAEAGRAAADTGAAAQAPPLSSPPEELPDSKPPAGSVDGRSVLSERELEVGQLVLTGLTYKQIGERLFISAKTVEHHVARMRQRLGVATRNELFDQLRSLLTPQGG